MGSTAAKQGDKIVATDVHIVLVPAPPSPPVPTPLPHPFSGPLNGSLSGNVNIQSLPAATVGSTADNVPPHIPTPPGTAFQKPPANRGTRGGFDANQRARKSDRSRAISRARLAGNTAATVVTPAPTSAMPTKPSRSTCSST